MKKIVAFVLVLCLTSLAMAQNSPVVVDTIVIRTRQETASAIQKQTKIIDTLTPVKKTAVLNERYNSFEMPSFWTSKNRFGLNFNEVAFINWNSGGDNSISTIASSYFERNYKFRYIQWDNSLDLRYGVIAQEGRKPRKTDDQIRLSSTFGYRSDTISKWYYSGKLNFNTQFANGYKYPDRDNPKSRFMAPGYLFLGIGASYIDNPKKFNLYLSPLTQKATFVLDQDLADAGAFGVVKATYDSEGNLIEHGERQRMELGFLVTNKYERKIADNIEMKSNLILYTDYIKSFGNIDVDWEVDFRMKVNDHISSNVGMHFIYDDDIKFDEVKVDGVVVTPGVARLQFKQLLGVGIVYTF